MVYLRQYNSKYKFTDKQYPDEKSSIDDIRKFLRNRVFQVRHNYINLPPTFLSHFTTNEQLTKMPNQDGCDLLRKYAVRGTVKVDIRKVHKLHGHLVVAECKRIRDELRAVEGLPPFQEFQPASKQPTTAKPSPRRNNLFKSTTSNLSGTKLDDYLKSNNDNTANENVAIKSQLVISGQLFRM